MPSGVYERKGLKRNGKTGELIQGPPKLRLREKTRENNGCIEWTGGVTRLGYGLIRDENGKTVQVHRLSWEIVNGPIPDGVFVLHRCDNRKCINTEHLFLGTQMDNIQDAIKKGRMHCDGSFSRQILNTEKVREIRVLLKAGTKCRDLANKYGVSYEHIQGIKHNRSWAGVV